MIPTRVLLSIPLFLMAATSWWLMKFYQSTQPGLTNERHDPDYFMENFTAIAMNEQGFPRHRLQGESMLHFMDDDTTEVSTPNIIIYDAHNARKPPWYIQSERGRMSSDGKLIWLLGHVEIHRAAAQSTRPVSIITRNLRVQPQNNYAETDAQAIIESGNLVQIGIGMQAFFKPPVRIKLQSKVRGKYETQ